jgi:hypothetical protein
MHAESAGTWWQNAPACNRTHEDLGHSCEHLPVPMFVRIGKIRASESAPETQMKLKAPARGQAGDDVAQTLAIGELSKTERQKMIKGRKAPRRSCIGYRSAHRANSAWKSGAVICENTVGALGIPKKTRL